MLVRFHSLHHPVQFANGMKVLPHLTRLFARWPYREIPKTGNPDILVNVLQEGDRYWVEAPWLEARQPYDGVADLAQGMAVHVARRWFEEHPGYLWLDAVASVFAGQLVVFVGGPQSGKNLLTACLAATGNPVFASSILAVSPDGRSATSLGLAPRLTLPLPGGLSEPLRSQLERRLDGMNHGLAYLRPGNGAVVPFGETAAIRAFVMLDRSAVPAATLSPASNGRLLRRMLLNSFAQGLNAETLLERVKDVVGDVPCYRMGWSDPQDAVKALRARFAAWRMPAGEDDGTGKQARSRCSRRPSGPRNPSGRRFRHRVGLTEHQVDSELFLVNPGGETIYHLNGLGAGLWRLLDGTHGLDDAVTVLKEAFPNVAAQSIESDVVSLVADLTDRGLLIEKVS